MAPPPEIAMKSMTFAALLLALATAHAAPTLPVAPATSMDALSVVTDTVSQERICMRRCPGFN